MVITTHLPELGSNGGGFNIALHHSYLALFPRGNDSNNRTPAPPPPPKPPDCSFSAMFFPPFYGKKIQVTANNSSLANVHHRENLSPPLDQHRIPNAPSAPFISQQSRDPVFVSSISTAGSINISLERFSPSDQHLVFVDISQLFTQSTICMIQLQPITALHHARVFASKLLSVSHAPELHVFPLLHAVYTYANALTCVLQLNFRPAPNPIPHSGTPSASRISVAFMLYPQCDLVYAAINMHFALNLLADWFFGCESFVSLSWIDNPHDCKHPWAYHKNWGRIYCCLGSLDLSTVLGKIVVCAGRGDARIGNIGANSMSGFAISSYLAKVLAKVFDSWIQRYSNTIVTATSSGHLIPLFDFICRGFLILDYKEHINFDVVHSSRTEINHYKLQSIAPSLLAHHDVSISHAIVGRFYVINSNEILMWQQHFFALFATAHYSAEVNLLIGDSIVVALLIIGSMAIVLDFSLSSSIYYPESKYQQALIHTMVLDSVTTGQILLAMFLYLYLRANLRSWVYLMACDIILSNNVASNSFYFSQLKLLRQEHVAEKDNLALHGHRNNTAKSFHTKFSCTSSLLTWLQNCKERMFEDLGNAKLQDFYDQSIFIFLVSTGKVQQWDPGGLLDIFTAAKSSRFKQWDPGKFVQETIFTTLRTRLILMGWVML